MILKGDSMKPIDGLRLSSDRSPLRGLAGNETVITWHDPEKEKPISGEAVILVGRNDFYWDAGYYMHPDEAKNVNRAIGWYFSSHEPVVGEIAWWGTFELPEIEEVEGE